MFNKLIKKQREDFESNKTNFFKGETHYREVLLEYNKKVLERERDLKDLQRKIDKENKNYNVQRTRKKNIFDREQKVEQLTYIDNKAQEAKENRTDYMESRKLMVQNLKKDLEKFKVGLLSYQEIEKRYAFLHNDREFKTMIEETKKQIHSGIF